MDSAIWGMLIASVVLAVLWYRNRSHAAEGAGAPVGQPSPSPDEWALSPAETVLRTPPRKH